MNLSDENFEKEIQNGKTPVLIDFWTEWCGPCQILGPILEKVAEEYKEKIVFAKVNVDSSPVSSQKYQISQIPTVVLFKGGKPASGFIGARPEEFIRQWLNEALGS
ncbi:MAG: thioredoxin [Patescibacteria group bacterium]